MEKIAVIGCMGRMGRLICSALKKSYEVIEIGKGDSIELAKQADLVVDFSSAQNSVNTALWCKANNKRLIIGATGQDEAGLNWIKFASQHIPIMMAGNFSIGILKLKSIIKHLNLPDLDSVTIFESHHKNKKDKPSGTALELKTAINNVFDCPVDILSVRGGQEIGLHEVNFYFGDEVIRVSHQAFSRQAFVSGVVIAIRVMLKQKQNGLYSFDEEINAGDWL